MTWEWVTQKRAKYHDQRYKQGHYKYNDGLNEVITSETFFLLI